MLHMARPHDAMQTYQKALDLNKAQNGTRERLVILRLFAEACIEAGCLVDALNTYEEIYILAGFLKIPPSKIIGWYRELARQCEIRQLLCLMITQPTSRKLTQYHSQASLLLIWTLRFSRDFWISECFSDVFTMCIWPKVYVWAIMLSKSVSVLWTDETFWPLSIFRNMTATVKPHEMKEFFLGVDF